jgi:hypothetical protein
MQCIHQGNPQHLIAPPSVKFNIYNYYDSTKNDSDSEIQEVTRYDTLHHIYIAITKLGELSIHVG